MEPGFGRLGRSRPPGRNSSARSASSSPRRSSWLWTLSPSLSAAGRPASIPYAEQHFPRNMCPLVKSTLGLSYANACPYGPDRRPGRGRNDLRREEKNLGHPGPGRGIPCPRAPAEKRPGRPGRCGWQEVREFAARIEELTGRKLEAERLAGSVRLMNRMRRALVPASRSSPKRPAADQRNGRARGDAGGADRR